MKKINVLVSGGGSGGHIYPAIAIVEALEKIADVNVLFIGANGRMEMEKIPACGYSIEGLPIAGFQRSLSFKNLFKNIQLPFKILLSLIKVSSIIYKFKPDVAIGTGGYASAPTLKMAQWFGIPTFIQEQNAQPGKTNLFLGLQARTAFVSYEESIKYFTRCEVKYTGNAIRSSFINNLENKQDAFNFFKLNPNKKTILITGGSLGARAINEGIEAHIEKINQAGIQLIWHTGKAYYNLYKKYDSDQIRVLDFIYEMNKAYTCSDLIITRAGGILFEIFVIGKPAIVLPSPYVADDHQTPNALALENKKAAIMMKDHEAKIHLVPTMLKLIHDAEKLKTMGEIMKSLAKPNAASEIALHILTYLKSSRINKKNEN